MHKMAYAALGALALAASPAFAQGQSGGHAGGGGMGGAMSGGVGNPMGAGAPGGVPGWNSDPRSAAGEVADSHGAFGREHAEQRQLTQAEQAQLLSDRADELRNQSAKRRADAFALRDKMRAGHGSSMSAKDIRQALRQDMEDWRDAFRISREDWQGQRDQWLVDRESLTPEQWAERRAMWFEARDSWIADQVTRAKAMAADGPIPDDEGDTGG